MAPEQKGNKETLLPYRVLDLTDEKGFLCGKILGDLGADVIKIEPPGGDPSRRNGPFYHNIPHPEKSLFWFAYNANKRGITLNLKTSDGKSIFKRLAQTADIVVESFPPGYLDKLGVGYTAIKEVNHRIIWTAITPFGQKCSYKDYKASDITISAMSGFTSLLGDPDRPPVRVSFPQSYMWAGLFAAVATLTALWHRETGGEGQFVDSPMQASTAWATDAAPYFWQAVKKIEKREGMWMTGRSLKGAIFPTAYPCKDGYIAFPLYGARMGGRAAVVSNKAIVEWMDSEGMAPESLKSIDWEKWDIGPASQEEVDQIIKPVGDFLKQKTKREFFEEVIKRRIMGYPVATAKDIANDPQLKARDFWEGVEYPELGTKITHPGAFAKFSEAACGLRRRAPLIGENNKEVYEGELGFSREEIKMLVERGVI